MNTKIYKQQWSVPSNSGGDDHKVSLKHDDTYQCDCWPFRRSKDTPRTCSHIAFVVGGGGNKLESKQLTENERATAMLRGWAEKGYRYLTWVSEPMYPWSRQTLERYKTHALYEDIRTFAIGNVRYIVGKEKPVAYQRAIDGFLIEIQALNLRTQMGRAKKPEFKKKFDDLCQYILFNSTGVINPNIDTFNGIDYTGHNEICNNGFWGKQLAAIEKRWRWLR